MLNPKNSLICWRNLLTVISLSFGYYRTGMIIAYIRHRDKILLKAGCEIIDG